MKLSAKKETQFKMLKQLVTPTEAKKTKKNYILRLKKRNKRPLVHTCQLTPGGKLCGQPAPYYFAIKTRRGNPSHVRAGVILLAGWFCPRHFAKAKRDHKGWNVEVITKQDH